MDISANIAHIREQLARACSNCGRNEDEVRLVAVSKKKPAADVDAAIQAGQTLFGESYVQECVEKIDGADMFHY